MKVKIVEELFKFVNGLISNFNNRYEIYINYYVERNENDDILQVKLYEFCKEEIKEINRLNITYKKRLNNFKTGIIDSMGQFSKEDLIVDYDCKMKILKSFRKKLNKYSKATYIDCESFKNDIILFLEKYKDVLVDNTEV